jgi:DNA-binding IclR family transcriptional regulator
MAERTYELSPQETRVYQAIAALEAAGDQVYFDQIVRASALPPDQVHRALHALLNEHRLVHELARVDRPDLGPRYELAPRS